MNQDERERIEWIDISKGIAIFLVVLGHSIQAFGNNQQLLFKIIYSFHMPVFFAVSGLTFSRKTEFGDFVRKKAKVLLLPYIEFVILTLLYNLIVAVVKGNTIEETASLQSKLTDTFLVTSESYFVNLWFLPSLFSALLMIYGISYLTDKNKLWGGGYSSPGNFRIYCTTSV